MSDVRFYEYDTSNGKRMLMAYKDGKYQYIATRGSDEIKKIRLECEGVSFSQLKRIRKKYQVNKKSRGRK